jgi:hypothetical protein
MGGYRWLTLRDVEKRLIEINQCADHGGKKLTSPTWVTCPVTPAHAYY